VKGPVDESHATFANQPNVAEIISEVSGWRCALHRLALDLTVEVWESTTAVLDG
jgi:hypothetical protein